MAGIKKDCISYNTFEKVNESNETASTKTGGSDWRIVYDFYWAGNDNGPKQEVWHAIYKSGDCKMDLDKRDVRIFKLSLSYNNFWKLRMSTRLRWWYC